MKINGAGQVVSVESSLSNKAHGWVAAPVSRPTPPTPTRCPHCGTVAAEVICHICKEPRYV